MSKKSPGKPYRRGPMSRVMAPMRKFSRHELDVISRAENRRLVRAHFMPRHPATGVVTPEPFKGPRYSADPTNPLGLFVRDEAFLTAQKVEALERAGFIIVRRTQLSQMIKDSAVRAFDRTFGRRG